MREIKFRAWDFEEYEMIYNVERTYDFGCSGFGASEPSFADVLEDNERYMIMQYTGLKDEENKGIYEGDIIEGGYLNPLSNEFMSKKYIVEYDKGSFIGKLIGHSPYGDTWIHFIKGKVIGNIYENPELLEVR